MSGNEQTDEWEFLSRDWWQTPFTIVPWSYPPLQSNPSCRPSKRTALQRISKANQSLKSRIARYLKGDYISRTPCEPLSSDLAGVRAVEEVLQRYEADVGFLMLDNLLRSLDTGWNPDECSFLDVEPALEEHRKRWEKGVQILLGDSYDRSPDDELAFEELPDDEGEEKLKNLSQMWDLCLGDVSIVDVVRSADIIDLTDSELSAESDPPPMTPKATKDSLSVLSPSFKPLSATASSFVPSPSIFPPLLSPPSLSPSPSPSPPVLDIVNFPTLRQTILSQPRKDDLDVKTKWPSKRQSNLLPSFLTEKSDTGSRRSKTRQIVDKMRSASDARRDSDFILICDERYTEPKPIVEENSTSSRANKKRTRRGRESISIGATDSVQSSSAEGTGSHQQAFTVQSQTHTPGTRPPTKHPKRASISSVRPPISTQGFPSSAPSSAPSFGGPVTPGSFPLSFQPPPPPQHPAFMHMNNRAPSYGAPFSYPYYSSMSTNGVMPPQTPYGNSYQTPYTPYNAFGKNLITGTSGIRHASW